MRGLTGALGTPFASWLGLGLGLGLGLVLGVGLGEFQVSDLGIELGDSVCD